MQSKSELLFTSNPFLVREGVQKYFIEFEIESLPRMANPSGRSTHWRAMHAESKKWKQLTALKIGTLKPPKPLEKARLTLIRFSSAPPDYDGLVRGFKHVVDGLVACGVLKNDTLEVTGAWNCFWEKAKPKQGKIRVIVKEREKDGSKKK